MYQCLLYSPYGQFVRPLDYIKVSGARKQNEVGDATITLDLDKNPAADFPRDAIVVILRDGKKIGGAIWRVRGRRVDRKRSARTIQVTLADQNTILARRIVAYRAGNTNSTKTGTAAALMQAFVSEQLAAAVDGTRNVSGFRVDSATTGGSTFTIHASFDNLLTVLKKIANAQTKAGTWFGFGVDIENSTGTLGEFSNVFRVYSDRAGVDRRVGAGSGGLLLSEASGTLTNVQTSEDWDAEPSFVYAAGGGEKELRKIAQASNTALIAASPIGRFEKLQDVSNVSDTNALQLEADSTLQENYGYSEFTADLVFGNGVEWEDTIGYGDVFNVVIAGQITTARLNAFAFYCDRENQDAITARVEGILA